MVEVEAGVVFVGVAIDVVDALGVEGGGAADEAMHLVTFFQKQFRQIGAILSGDTGDQRAFHGNGY